MACKHLVFPFSSTLQTLDSSCLFFCGYFVSFLYILIKFGEFYNEIYHGSVNPNQHQVAEKNCSQENIGGNSFIYKSGCEYFPHHQMPTVNCAGQHRAENLKGRTWERAILYIFSFCSIPFLYNPLFSSPKFPPYTPILPRPLPPHIHSFSPHSIYFNFRKVILLEVLHRYCDWIWYWYFWP